MHFAYKESVPLHIHNAGVHSVNVQRIVQLSLKDAVFDRDRAVAVHKVRRVGYGGEREPSRAAGVETVQADVAAGLRNKAHAVTGQNRCVMAGHVRGITAEDARTHPARGRQNQNVADRRIAVNAVNAQLPVRQVFTGHVPEQAAQIMVGGTGLVFAGVSPKLHVQLYAVIAGAARLGADQFPMPHDELLAALHDLGIHEPVAVRDNAYLHDHGARIFQSEVPQCDVLGAENGDVRRLAGQAERGTGEVDFKILHALDQNRNAVRTVEAVIGDTQVTLRAKGRVKRINRGGIEHQLAGMARPAGGKRPIQPQRVIVGNIKIPEMQYQTVHTASRLSCAGDHSPSRDSRSARDRKPTAFAAISPLRNRNTVGMLSTRYAVASSGCSSTFTFPTFSTPSCASAISAMTGASIRHGPHQVAQKSTSTGRSPRRTSSSKFSLVSVSSFMFIFSFSARAIRNGVKPRDAVAFLLLRMRSGIPVRPTLC